MNFLKKFGQAVGEGLKIVMAFEGISIPGFSLPSSTQSTIQKVEGGLEKLMGIILSVEVMAAPGNLTNDQMLAMEAAMGEQVFLSVLKDLNTKFQIQDEALFKASVAQAVNGIAGILKSGHPDAIQTQNLSA